LDAASADPARHPRLPAEISAVMVLVWARASTDVYVEMAPRPAPWLSSEIVFETVALCVLRLVLSGGAYRPYLPPKAGAAVQLKLRHN